MPKKNQEFHLPKDVTFSKEPLPNGMAYVFRHQELGLLGRILVQDHGIGQCVLSCEIAGDPGDPMTAKREAIFKPAAMEITQRFQKIIGGPEIPVNPSLQTSPRDQGEYIESKIIQCRRCNAGVALLIIAINARNLGEMEDYARKMFSQVKRLNLPSYVIGPMIDDGGPVEERPSNVLKIWPEREPMRCMRPSEFNPILAILAKAHCGGEVE